MEKLTQTFGTFYTFEHLRKPLDIHALKGINGQLNSQVDFFLGRVRTDGQDSLSPTFVVGQLPTKSADAGQSDFNLVYCFL